MNEVWHDVIDLQLWEMTSITDECFEVDGGNRYMNSADIEGLIAEVKRLREQVKDLEYEVEHWQGELQSRMHPIDYDALVNGGEEE